MRMLIVIIAALTLCGHATAQTGNPAADIRMNTIEFDAQRRLDEQKKQIERQMEEQRKQVEDQQRQLDELRQRMPNR